MELGVPALHLTSRPSRLPQAERSLQGDESSRTCRRDSRPHTGGKILGDAAAAQPHGSRPDADEGVTQTAEHNILSRSHMTGCVTSDLPVRNSQPEREKLTGRTQHQDGPVRWQPNILTGRITNVLEEEEPGVPSTVGTGFSSVRSR